MSPTGILDLSWMQMDLWLQMQVTSLVVPNAGSFQCTFPNDEIVHFPPDSMCVFKETSTWKIILWKNIK